MSNYEILELKKGATQEEIKQAYKRLAKIHHPDKGGSHEMFIKIHTAFENLSKGITGETQQTASKPRYNPYQAPALSVIIYRGAMLSEGAFQVTFAVQNVGRVIALGGLMGMTWRTKTLDRGLVTIYFTKSELEMCDYYIELAFEAPNGKFLIKEIKVKRPPKPLTTWQKFVKTIKNII